MGRQLHVAATDPQLASAYPDRAVAMCSRDQAAALVEWDHHAVEVAGRRCVLYMLPWMAGPLEELPEPPELVVVFHYAGAHPSAPPAVQAVVDRLVWRFSATHQTPANGS